MRYPEFLPKNGTIGFIAPSFGCAEGVYLASFESAERKLSSLGYRIVEGPNARAAEGIGISSTPEKCGAEAEHFLTCPGIDAVISCGGGELMCETLDFISFERLKKEKPRWFMGFSDNTNLTFLLATLCDTASVYGPCAPAFGMHPWHQVCYDALGLLSGGRNVIRSYGTWQGPGDELKDEEHPLAPYHTVRRTRLHRYPEGPGALTMRGRLIGGCLDCLVNLAGTEYDRVPEFCRNYESDGILWFFECCDLNVFDMERALWHLLHCGWFRKPAGFLVGRPLHFGEASMGLDQYKAVLDILSRFEVPVIMDIDLGHLPPSMPLLTGAIADVHCAGNQLEIRFTRK